MIRPYSYMAKL